MDTNFKDFERSVAELLSLAGFQVQPEQIVGHKKVDLLAFEVRLGKARQIAVECKAYSRVLSQKEVSEIYANYLPLCKSNLIDEVLLVTDAGLAPSATTMVAELRELNHLSLVELQNLVMDFRGYLESLVEQFLADGLSEYYISSRLRDGGDLLEETVLHWVRAEYEDPLAILGSYGMGKTSFARRLSYVLAQEAIKDSQARIPAYIRLNEISAEQSLEGLLGRVFTASNLVRGYSFHAFMRLNQLGRFVVILDGFDEMKHTLSWDEFKFNFRQINRLVSGLSKVMVLGRPTAFLSDEEQRHALKGVRLYFGQEIREPDWPTYTELYLAPFNGRDIELFLRRYIDYKKRSEPTSRDSRLYKTINEKITEISGKRMYDIASRPVQLRMIAEVLPQWKGPIDEMTVTVLYSHFIDLIIEREQDKLVRRHFDTTERRSFARALAWWLWTQGQSTGNTSGLTAAEIPDQVLSPFMSPDLDRGSVVRDLVSACFLERKQDSLYFPHRSFQEFLVAEEMVEWLKSPDATLIQADRYCTPEVGNFVGGIAGDSDLIAWEKVLKPYRGQLSSALVKAWTGVNGRSAFLETRAEETGIPWYIAFLASSGNGLDTIMSLQSKTGNLTYCMLCHLCLMLLLSETPPHKRNDQLSGYVLGLSLRELCRTALGILWAAPKKGRKRDSHQTPEDYLANAIESTRRVGRAMDSRIVQFMAKVIIGKTRGVVDIGGTYRVLSSVLKEYCLLTEWISGTTLKAKNGKNITALGFSTEGEHFGASTPNPKHFELVEKFKEAFVG